MSTTACRRCNGLISFVLSSNGRWRPVEAQYTAFELDEDEVIALRVEGNLAAQAQAEVRVYRYHHCPEDPSLRVGRPRTVVVESEVVDQTTGVVEEPEEKLPCHGRTCTVDNHQTGCRWEPRPPYVCPTCEAVDDHNGDECPEDDAATWRRQQHQRHYERCKSKIPASQVNVQCPICSAREGEPCWNARGDGYREATHDQRGWVTAFGDDEPWPPDPKQRGYPVMKRWLRENADLFATPQEVQ